MKSYILSLTTLFIMAASHLAFATPAEEECPVDPQFVIRDYEPYAIEYEDTEDETIEFAAEFIFENIDNLTDIEVIGHSAAYGDQADNEQAASDRAEFVYNILIEKVRAQIEQSYDIERGFYHRGVDCPLTSNDTQDNRDINRRVEIYLVFSEDDEEYEEDGEDEDNGGYEDDGSDDEAYDEDANEDNDTDTTPSLSQTLESVKSNTSNRATRCLANRLLSEGGDSKFLNRRSIDKITAAKPSQKTKRLLRQSTQDLASQVQTAYERFTAKESERTVKEKMLRLLERKRKSIVKAIDDLDVQANCTDKRVHSLRTFVLNRSKQKDSIYSCKPIKKKVNAMMKSIGGKVDGCNSAQ